MGKLTTHVLDTTHGRPASGVSVAVFRLSGGRREPVAACETNSDGRSPGPLLEGATFVAGIYEIVFGAADYFRGAGVALPALPFLEDVVLRFGVADASQNYHVPLVMTPWSYSTYRGS